LASVDRYDQEFEVSQSAFFGYNQIGVSSRKNSEVSNEDEILPTIISNIEDVFKAYRKLKEYFVSEICPTNADFEFSGDYALIHLRGFLEGLSTNKKAKILKSLMNTLKKFVQEPRLIGFSDEMKKLETKREIKPETIDSVSRAQALPFYSLYIMAEEIYLFIYHYGATRPLALDPSHGIIDCAKFGFTNSLHLLDLHYSIKKMYEDIEKQEENLKALEKRWLPRDLSEHHRRVNDIENKAEFYENSLKENIEFVNAIYQGLKEPHDNNFKKRPEFYEKAGRVLDWINSLPNSLLESAGLLEYVELGGMTSLTRDVKPLKSKMDNLENKLGKNRLTIILGLYFLSLLFIIPCGIYYKSKIGDLADIIELLTFGVAILIMSVRLF